MKHPENVNKEIKSTFTELEKYAGYARERLILLLRGLSKTDMIAKINELQLSDKSLAFLCEGIALETEDYEICAAVEEIKRLRLQHKNSAAELNKTIPE